MVIPVFKELEYTLCANQRIGYFAELALGLYAISNKLKIKSYPIEFKIWI